ncbi:MAG: hypothetical protein HGA85_08765 [Nanoarchaeota archaeon]|nr:hypothetical protein [Nanoarchaeota archaeon]
MEYVNYFSAGDNDPDMGIKAKSLLTLYKAGFKIPPGFIVSGSLLRDILSSEAFSKILDAIKSGEDQAEKCVGEDALAVAKWMHGAFYSSEARARR